jgi:NTE family protein
MERAESRPWCLVLSGGGAKGVYHIGVLRALRELGVGIEACIGNSIGAIVAAFIAQGLDAALDEIGDSIGLGSIVDLGPDLPAQAGGSGAALLLGRLKRVWRSFEEGGGLDTSPLRAILERHLDEAAIRRGGVDLGLVTVGLDGFRPRELFLEDMEEGSLVDWLMASSALPGFAPPEIGGKRYVDGGLHDNMPYDMALARGYRRIIVVDVQGAGVNRRPETEGTETVYIRNSITMGSVLDFDRRFLDEFRLLGYLDSLRAFGRLWGHRLFLKPEPGLEARFRAAFPGLKGQAAGGELALPVHLRHERRVLLALLECAAQALELPRVRLWSYGELAAAIAEAKEAEEARVARILGPGGEGARAILDRLLVEAAGERRLDGTPYGYSRLAAALPAGGARAALEAATRELWPELGPAEDCFATALPFLRSQAAGILPEPELPHQA